jgi:cytochrome c biogenesis protein CcdA
MCTVGASSPLLPCRLCDVLHVMSYALIDTLNILLIGVVVAVGVMLPAAEKGGRYGRIAALLIFGDWLGVLLLALLSLLVFDGIGDAVGTFVDSPVFGILLILTGVFIGVMAWRGDGDNTAMVERILGPLRTPTPATLGTGLVLGLVQSVTSGPFFAGILVMSAGDFSAATRYLGMLGYASVALSLPFLTAVAVGYVRRRPDSWLGSQFVVMRRNSVAVARGAGYLGAVLLTLLGVTHLL